MKVKILSGRIKEVAEHPTLGNLVVHYSVQVGNLMPQRVSICFKEFKKMTKEQIFEYIKKDLGLLKLKGIENDVTGEEFEV